MARGTVEAICISDTKGVKKNRIEAGYLIEGHGLEHDAHAQAWHRQVSLLAKESIKKMQDAGSDVVSGDFGENIVTSGLELTKLSPGTKIYIGDKVILKVTQIGKTCHERCAIYYQAGDCIMPSEGIFGEVLQGGTAKVGDFIEV